jgi:hypothetical protein
MATERKEQHKQGRSRPDIVFCDGNDCDCDSDYGYYGHIIATTEENVWYLPATNYKYRRTVQIV